MWALPGGFAEMDENIEDTAKRELQEETGLTGITMHQIGAFGKVGRDPRHRTITVAFLSLLEHQPKVTAADDASEARWFSVKQLPSLAFDHDDIILAALSLRDRLKNNG